jgi:hemerythrin
MNELNNLDVIQWKSEFNIGLQRIDFEHRIFLELVNSFKIALDNHRPDNELVRLLTEIEKYAEFHFVSEENCMFVIQYPDLKNHQIQHFELLEQFNLAKYEKFGFVKFYKFIKDWFINHTIYEDMKIKDYINQNQIDIDRLRHRIEL